MKVTYGKSVYDNREINAVVQVLKKTTQMGPKVRAFEEKIAKLFSKKYGIMVNSGSSALLLAFKILDFPKGSEIIAPALNFGTAVSSMIFNNLTPSFVDVERNTYNIDVTLIEKAINKKTKAICVPNLIGNLPDWIALKKIAKKYKLILIEDSADTLGSTFNSKNTGFYSDITITSFYGSHVINCAGNGGMLCLNNSKLFKEGLLYRSWGRSSSLLLDRENIKNRFNKKLDNIPYDQKFIFERPGFNIEPSEIGAAFGLVQLKKLNKNIKIRKKNFNMHYKFFEKNNNHFENPKIHNLSNTNFLAFPFTIKNNKKFDRKSLQIFLEKNNIQTRVVFTGNILRQPGFKKIKHASVYNKFPESDRVMKYGVLIGLHHGLTSIEINRIHNKILEFLK